MNHTSKTYDAIIIGGGLGGLVCTLALIKKGKKVRLLEKIHMVGGCQGYFKSVPIKSYIAVINSAPFFLLQGSSFYFP